MKISEALDNWDACDELTMKFLGLIPVGLYHTKPFEPRFRSFAWEFACLLTTRQMYVNGIGIGKLDGNTPCVPEKEATEYSLEKMKMELEKTDKAIMGIIKGKEGQIDFFGKKTSSTAVISWLMQHEQLHYGKLMLYFSKSGLELPLELKKMWGEGSFGGHTN